MHLLITDSGVGGLSVCAYAERFLRIHGWKDPVRLTYVNASPENEFGYNAMGSRQEKLDYFDRFLHIVSERFRPDAMYVACNTLSVLLQDTGFVKEAVLPVDGIVESGIDRLMRELGHDRERVIMIFGTATTIEAGTYSALLQQRGVPHARIINQACPGLADTISEDRHGSLAKKQIEACVSTALQQLERPPVTCLVYLACTHYGYRKELFATAFSNSEIRAIVLNPNEFVAEELFGWMTDPEHSRGLSTNRGSVDVQFITRYRIPETALETITFFLNDVSPATVHAFQNYIHMPDLF